MEPGLAHAEPWEREWAAPDATQTAEIVCESCNGGWMNDLESAAAPLLTPMMLGEARTLDVAEQGILALWATKMAMVWEAISPYVRSVSDDDYVHVLKWELPPTNWRVWTAAYAGSSWNTCYFKHPLRMMPVSDDLDPTRVRAEEVNGHLSTFGVQAFVFHVFGAQLPDIRRPVELHETRFGRYRGRSGPSSHPSAGHPNSPLTIIPSPPSPRAG